MSKQTRKTRSKEPNFNEPENDQRPTLIKFPSSIYRYLTTNKSKSILIYEPDLSSYFTLILAMIRAGLLILEPSPRGFNLGANQIGQLCFRVMEVWNKVKSWGGAGGTRGLDTAGRCSTNVLPSLSSPHREKI